MKVIFLCKETETFLHIDNVEFLKKETVAIGFSEKKFRHEWHLKIKNIIYEKTYPCSKFEIHTIIS